MGGVSLIRIVAVLAIVGPSCPSTSDEAPIATPPRKPAEAREKLGPVESVERATTDAMPRHFQGLRGVHDALIRGSVIDARAAAASIAAEQPSLMLESWAPYVYATRQAAKAVVDAADLPTAAAAAADLARSCGACHTAQGARIPSHVAAPPVAADTDDKAKMRRHQWAFDRLWESLVLPSDAAWKAGVEAFVELPTCRDNLSGEQDRDAIRRATDSVRSHQQAARGATTTEARAEIYGALLSTCSSCHASEC